MTDSATDMELKEALGWDRAQPMGDAEIVAAVREVVDAARRGGEIAKAAGFCFSCAFGPNGTRSSDSRCVECVPDEWGLPTGWTRAKPEESDAVAALLELAALLKMDLAACFADVVEAVKGVMAARVSADPLPPETAPKDGKPFLGIWGAEYLGRFSACYWDANDEVFRFVCGSKVGLHVPRLTGWRPRTWE